VREHSSEFADGRVHAAAQSFNIAALSAVAAAGHVCHLLYERMELSTDFYNALLGTLSQ
jgi:hypothetical protein